MQHVAWRVTQVQKSRICPSQGSRISSRSRGRLLARLSFPWRSTGVATLTVDAGAICGRRHTAPGGIEANGRRGRRKKAHCDLAFSFDVVEGRLVFVCGATQAIVSGVICADFSNYSTMRPALGGEGQTGDARSSPEVTCLRNWKS